MDDLQKLKDKKKVNDAADRLCDLIRALPDRDYALPTNSSWTSSPAAAKMAKVKGTYYSGSDVVETVLYRMGDGPKPLKIALAAPTPNCPTTSSTPLFGPAARRSRRPKCTTPSPPTSWQPARSRARRTRRRRQSPSERRFSTASTPTTFRPTGHSMTTMRTKTKMERTRTRPRPSTPAGSTWD